MPGKSDMMGVKPAAVPGKAKPTGGSSLTLFVRGLPAEATNERLEELFSETGPVRQCFVVREKGAEKCRGFGYVTFSMLEDAQRAMKEVKEYDGKKIEVMAAKKKLRDKDKKTKSKESSDPPKKEQNLKQKTLWQKKARLIIRNLSFKCSEEDLKNHFSKFGSVLEVSIPTKPDGKMRGFAFVQFKNMMEAGKALKGTNMKSIKGRTVAVDWAVAKDKYTAAQGAPETGTKETTEGSDAADDQSDDESEPDNEEEADGSESDNEEEADGSESDNEEEADGSDPEDEDGESEEEKKPVKTGPKVQEKPKKSSAPEITSSDDDVSADSGQDSDDEQDSEDSDSEEKVKKTDPKKKRKLPSDVNQGKTLFIRNLSFNSEEEDLEELLLAFGNIKYVRIVVHPDTEHSKGCAFVQFVDKESTEKCLTAASDQSENGGLKLDGRRLIVNMAVSREEAGKLRTEKKVKKPTGTRNLYLAREGFIREGTKAAEGLSAEDLAKRARFTETKREKLKSHNIFISKTRLCVHNIPKSVDDQKLRQLFLSAASGGRNVKIKESRVMRDMKGVGGNIKGQSLGYGFVEFLEHEHALAALRHVNNNPDIFGPQKRPIVEFSLEDMNKLKIKQRRQQRSLEVLRMKEVKALTAQGTQQVMGNPKKNKQKKAGAPSTTAPSEKKGAQNTTNKAMSSINKPQAATAVKGPIKRVQSETTEAQKDPKRAKADTTEQPGQSPGPSDWIPWSGFRTKEEIEEEELPDGTKKKRKVLPLPSRLGPKIRARDKAKVQQRPLKKPKGPSRKQRRQIMVATKQVTAKKPQSKRNAESHFNHLVEQYKRKIMGKPTASAPVKRSKWFDD
ncbi:RNA-binding protein 28 [Bombina bombina]|uniref:RNA-binding protein 28 n=1 Tax=Bombina bombina TaxID=8345 RepID=UPI00235A7732|nr:RNA-binding protein 28 [Bombina bombina]